MMENKVEGMELSLVATDDGSKTLFRKEIDDCYHSKHGAAGEGRHIFIGLGLAKEEDKSKPIRILEIGFGTGLNALLTLEYARANELQVEYIGLEPYPISYNWIEELGYGKELGLQGEEARLHSSEWDSWQEWTPEMRIRKVAEDAKAWVKAYQAAPIDGIYFDAFAPDKQPDMWTEEFFADLCQVLKPGGWLVTYSSKGVVRRAFEAAGFIVEKHTGPVGKREVIRCVKR